MFDLFGNLSTFKTDGLCVPYMGSKRKHADKLICMMLERKPGCKYFYDLCGGGGAMSFAALQKGMTVFYNDAQADLVDFMRFVFERMRLPHGQFGMFPDEFYSFVSREEFTQLKHEHSAYAQFVRICYSFGNNQRDHLFNPEIEKLKHLAHNIVVFQCENSLLELQSILGIPLSLSGLSTLNERRLEFGRQIKILCKRLDLEQLERLEQLEQKISFTNLSYENVCIDTPIDETIVYLDPPYRNTRKYIEGLCHNQLDSYFANLPYLAFMSEYSAPFKCVFQINTRSTFSSTSNSCAKIERLFVNR